MKNKNKKIINVCLLMIVICFALSGCNDKKKENENIGTSTDATPIEITTVETVKDTTEAEKTTEVTTEKVTEDKTETDKKTTQAPTTTEAPKPQTTQTTTEAPKPQTTQAPATTQATTEAPKPTTTQQATTQAPTTEAQKPATTQAPATTRQATTEAPATTEHQHTWESVGHTETHDYRTDTGADVTGQQIVVHNGQECIITGYNSGYQCNACGFKSPSGEEVDNHTWDVHGGSSTSTYRDPIYVAVTQKSIYVEDYQRCSTCGAKK